MSADRELWRWVVGYEGLYMVSSFGSVMSVPCMQMRGNRTYAKSGMEIVHHDNGSGYRVLSLYMDGKQKQCTVHRLVAEAFIPNPNKLPEVNHKDGDKSNNRAENLEWVTRSENIEHAVNELDAFGFNRTLTEEQVISIRTDDRPESEIGKEYGLAQSTINAIRTGRAYKSFGGQVQTVGRQRQRKLTSEQIVDIRNSSLSGVELSKKYGVATSTICKIRKHERYKEVV